MATTFEIARTTLNGKPAVELVVRWATAIPAIDALTLSLGYTPTVGISNRRSIICADAASIDAAREPIMPFFDKSVPVANGVATLRAI